MAKIKPTSSNSGYFIKTALKAEPAGGYLFLCEKSI